MDKPSTLFTGIFGAFIVSCSVMVLLPNREMGSLQPNVGDWDGSAPSVPNAYPFEKNLIGRTEYVANGCFYCHTQQVRDPQYGPDMERGWGVRRTVARDYIFEDVPLLGSTRLGPDFANYGAVEVKADGTKVRLWRNEPADDPKKPAVRDETWIYKHLFNPKIIVDDSNCPPMRQLFVRHELGEKPSPHAAHVEGAYEWLPSAEARNLAAYLLGQDCSPALPEAPTMIKPKEEKKK